MSADFARLTERRYGPDELRNWLWNVGAVDKTDYGVRALALRYEMETMPEIHFMSLEAIRAIPESKLMEQILSTRYGGVVEAWLNFGGEIPPIVYRGLLEINWLVWEVIRCRNYPVPELFELLDLAEEASALFNLHIRMGHSAGRWKESELISSRIINSNVGQYSSTFCVRLLGTTFTL